MAAIAELSRTVPALVEEIALNGRRRHPTPLAAAVKGLLAAAAGTALMTAYQMAVMKARGAEGSSVPGEVGKRLIEGLTGRRVPDERMELLNNAMHFLYGTSWGLPYGLLQGSRPGGVAKRGVQTGLAVWGVSLIELPALDLGPPVWEYPPTELALDVSYHLVYGLGTATAYRALDR